MQVCALPINIVQETPCRTVTCYSQSEQMVGNVALNSSRGVEGNTQRVTSYPGVKCYAAPPFALVASEQMPDAMQH